MPRTSSKKRIAMDKATKSIAKRWTPFVNSSVDTSKQRLEKSTGSCLPKDDLPAPTASQSKLGDLDEREESSTNFQCLIASQNQLGDVVRELACPSCSNVGTLLNCEKSFGVVVKMSLTCVTCAWTGKNTYSSTALDNRAHLFDINRRVVSSFLRIGKGHNALETFCAVMDMPCMSKNAFQDHQTAVTKSWCQAAEEILADSWKRIESAHKEIKNVRNSDGNLDIAVSFDATWHRRGFQSNYGVGFVIDLHTGLVIDYHCLSKHCRECTISANDLGEDSPEFYFWYTGHKDACKHNWSGSSPSMEAEICKTLWTRSVEKCGFRYTTLLSDGDAKSHAELCKLKPYGEQVDIIKEECVNHVEKRVGKGLRVLRKNGKLGGKGKGKLNEAAITKLTYYYGHAIRSNNNGDLQQMKSAILASLLHCNSTDANPRHMKCPPGETSWCFYNKAKARGEQPLSHDTAIKTPISSSTLSSIMPLYQRLASDSLLSRCLRGKTQNANESLHATLWAFCPKTIFIGKERLDGCIALAASQWNTGVMKSFEKLSEVQGTPVADTGKVLTRRRDKERIKQSIRKAAKKYNVQRRYKKVQALTSEEKKVNLEGTTYASGSF